MNMGGMPDFFPAGKRGPDFSPADGDAFRFTALSVENAEDIGGY